MASPSLSPSSQILETKKFVLTHLAYSQMNGAVVNYLHPFLSIRRQLGPGELWGGGNTDSQAGQPERHRHRFTLQNSPTSSNLPLVLSNDKRKPRKSLQRMARIKPNTLSLKARDSHFAEAVCVSRSLK